MSIKCVTTFQKTGGGLVSFENIMYCVEARVIKDIKIVKLISGPKKEKIPNIF